MIHTLLWGSEYFSGYEFCSVPLIKIRLRKENILKSSILAEIIKFSIILGSGLITKEIVFEFAVNAFVEQLHRPSCAKIKLFYSYLEHTDGGIVFYMEHSSMLKKHRIIKLIAVDK